MSFVFEFMKGQKRGVGIEKGEEIFTWMKKRGRSLFQRPKGPDVPTFIGYCSRGPKYKVLKVLCPFYIYKKKTLVESSFL